MISSYFVYISWWYVGLSHGKPEGLTNLLRCGRNWIVSERVFVQRWQIFTFVVEPWFTDPMSLFACFRDGSFCYGEKSCCEWFHWVRCANYMLVTEFFRAQDVKWLPVSFSKLPPLDLFKFINDVTRSTIKEKVSYLARLLTMTLFIDINYEISISAKYKMTETP
jgi:hypothetical protein